MNPEDSVNTMPASRWRLSGTALLLAACLLATGACGMRGSLPEGAEMIPADATFAVSVDVPAITNSRLYKRYESDERFFGRNRMNFYRFAEATGLDPANDIKRLVFMARAGEEGPEEMSALAIGTFDGRKVHQFLVDQGMPSRQVAGVDIFEFIVIQDRCVFCLAVIDASTAAFGDGETLAKIAQVKSGAGEALALLDGPGRLLRRVGRGVEAWGILRADDLKERMAGMLGRLDADTGPLKALGPIQEVSFSFDTAEPMRLVLEVTAASEKDAMMVADILKGAESLGRLTLRETRPDLGLLMSDLVIEADTGLVRAAGSIPASDFDKVARLLGADWLADGLSPDAPSGTAGEPSP